MHPGESLASRPSHRKMANSLSLQQQKTFIILLCIRLLLLYNFSANFPPLSFHTVYRQAPFINPTKLHLLIPMVARLLEAVSLHALYRWRMRNSSSPTKIPLSADDVVSISIGMVTTMMIFPLSCSTDQPKSCNYRRWCYQLGHRSLRSCCPVSFQPWNSCICQY